MFPLTIITFGGAVVILDPNSNKCIWCYSYNRISLVELLGGGASVGLAQTNH